MVLVVLMASSLVTSCSNNGEVADDDNTNIGVQEGSGIESPKDEGDSDEEVHPNKEVIELNADLFHTSEPLQTETPEKVLKFTAESTEDSVLIGKNVEIQSGALIRPGTIIGDGAFEGCSNVEKLYIGSSIESIGSMAFAGCEKITEIKVAWEKPIRGNADIFTNAVYDNATLYIPTGTEQLYQKREPWNIFFYIVEMDFTGVEELKAEGGNVKAIYDLQGRVVENPSNGMYIIDGKKVLIK